jgi:thiol:disulfide interchange protein DsbC
MTMKSIYAMALTALFSSAVFAQAAVAPPASEAARPAPASAQMSANEQLAISLAARIGVPKIDEITRTPFGLLELRVGTDLLYADPTGTYLFQGVVFDLNKRENLTQTRIDKLTAVDWKDLPLQDAIKITRGNGKRQLAIFEDPNCGYCRVIERNISKISDVTLYVFLLPILSERSVEQSKQIWCSADRAKAWNEWILENKAPTAKSDCNTQAVSRNQEFARKYKINGTPAVFFPNGVRVPGAISAEEVEKRLLAVK